MKIKKQSDWNRAEIEAFLATTITPLRLSFLAPGGEPRICPLWYLYEDGAIWSASHRNAYVIRRLFGDGRVGFDISTNDYPYRGVRGNGTAELVKDDGEKVLRALIERYLGDSNRPLAEWLLSRATDEYAIRIVPSSVNAWDFSGRMEK